MCWMGEAQRAAKEAEKVSFLRLADLAVLWGVKTDFYTAATGTGNAA